MWLKYSAINKNMMRTVTVFLTEAQVTQYHVLQDFCECHIDNSVTFVEWNEPASLEASWWNKIMQTSLEDLYRESAQR